MSKGFDHVHSDGGFLGPLGCVQRFLNPAEQSRVKQRKETMVRHLGA